MIEDLNKHQPHIVVNTGDEVHVVPVALIRNIANGNHLADNKLVRLMAKIILDELGL